MTDDEKDDEKLPQEILDLLDQLGAVVFPGGADPAPVDTGNYIIDNEHRPIHVTDSKMWAQWLATHDTRLKQENIGPYRVSTIFLGVDHNHFRLFLGDGAGPPILFETMVFNVIGHDISLAVQERYETWDEALAGHERIAAKFRAAVSG